MYGMNQGYNVGDPSAQVPINLLPHVHLVSQYRFPTLPTLQPAQALEYLIKAPQIVRDTSAVAWNFFQAPPPDGTVLLTWQPPRLQTHYASDGLVWADPETAYDMNIRGYNVQVLVHNSGYHYPHEPYAVHARYRYRIAQGPGQTDPNLWLVHYRAAEPAHRIPASQIPIQREVHQQLAMRAQLQAAGPLMRKEFMLMDQANWPKVEFAQPAMRGQQPYYNPMQPGRPYAAQPPPAKRQRLPAQQQARQPVAGSAAVDTTLEEEENATQDTFDFLTPRDISLSRYKQHHEWMEEIFSSPHAVGKIAPIDLGLGLMGELAPLTAGILDAPGGENQEVSKENYKVKNYYKLEPEQLKDFEKRVTEYAAKEQAELDKLKAAHAKKMAHMKRSRTYIKAERRLRELPRSADAEKDDEDPADSVVQDLEKSLGVTFDTKKLVVCVEKGGFIEAQQPEPQKAQVNGDAPPSNANGSTNGLGNDSAIEGDNTAASLLDQYGSGSLTGTPGANLSVPQLSQPPSQSQSAVATPSAPGGDPAQPSSFDEQAANLDSASGNDLLDLDVEMSGMTNASEKTGDDWVMVEGQTGSTDPAPQSTTTQAPSASTATAPAVPTAPADPSPISAPAVGEDAGSMFDGADFSAFDSIDTAGDALADYTTVDDDNMGLGDLVDDSAFGDAFHGTEMHHGESGEGDNA